LKAGAAAPAPNASEFQRAKCSSNFSWVRVATPTAPQRSLKGRERQALALDVERDRGQQPGQPFFKRRQAFTHGLSRGTLLFGTLCFISFNDRIQLGFIRFHTRLLL
jgi:hypothetical protein